MTSVIRPWHLHSEGAAPTPRSGHPLGLPWVTPLENALCTCLTGRTLPRASLRPLVLSLAQPGVPRRPGTTLHRSTLWGETGRLPFLSGLVTSSPLGAGLAVHADKGYRAHRRRYRSVYLLGRFPKGESDESCSDKIGIIC